MSEKSKGTLCGIVAAVSYGMNPLGALSLYRAYFAGDYIDVVFCSCVGVYNTSVEVVGLSRT